MESLQLAQMLADISDLSATDPKAANAMVNANKTLPTNPPHPQDVLLKPPQSAAAGTPRPSSSASQSRFDKFGRKILTPPAMSRTNSTGPPSRDVSHPGTPRGADIPNDDIHQASHLMTLYEIRNKLKQQDSTGLKKAREQIDALIEKTKQRQQSGQQGEVQSYSERPRPVSRTYTYPKSGSTADATEAR